MICNKCGADKPDDEFYRRKNGDPYNPCKACKIKIGLSNKRQKTVRKYSSEVNEDGDPIDHVLAERNARIMETMDAIAISRCVGDWPALKGDSHVH